MQHIQAMRPQDKIMLVVNLALWGVVLPLVSMFN